jgi:hypothetical protein
MTPADHAIYQNLAGTECVCLMNKRRAESFCKACYFVLPRSMRRALYVREGYCDTFRKACELLKLDPPKQPEVAGK